MARERVKLTDKEEKILIQAQLMGLTTASMVKIGNRLKAIEKESDYKNENAELAGKFTSWKKLDEKGWELEYKDGRVFVFSNRSKEYRHNGWNQRAHIKFDIGITKPGTRANPVSKLAVTVPMNTEWWGPAKFMPEKSKELCGIMRMINNGTLDSL